MASVRSLSREKHKFLQLTVELGTNEIEELASYV